jgi:hypothetical protein
MAAARTSSTIAGRRTRVDQGAAHSGDSNRWALRVEPPLREGNLMHGETVPAPRQ